MANDYSQDAGHGGVDPGALFNGHIEKVYALEAAAYVNRRLNELGIKSSMTRISDVSLDATKRTNIVKQSKAKVCLSHHFNAGRGDGTETIHSINSNGKLATLIAKSIAAAGVKFRRVFSKKGTNGDYYYMHRMTGSVQTVIVEYEFLDGPNNEKLKSKSFRESLYEATVKAVCEYEKVTYRAPSSSTTLSEGGNQVAKTDYEKNAKPSPALAPEVKLAIEAGITDGTYLKRPATREEVAVMVLRGLNK